MPILLCLFALAGAQATITVFSSPEQLLEALSTAASPGAASETVLELGSNVALTQEAANNYTLPFVIPSNHSITFQGGESMIGTPRHPPPALRPRPAFSAH